MVIEMRFSPTRARQMREFIQVFFITVNLILGSDSISDTLAAHRYQS